MAQSKTRRFINDHQREFVKLFDAACQRHNRWSVFADFVHMAAIAISNTVDKVHAEEREKTYMQMAGQYNKKELECFARMLSEIVEGLEADPDQDLMGNLFMNLDLGNQYRGQFFTPYHVSRLMSEVSIAPDDLTARIEKQGWIAVNDCACGAGGLLIAFANVCMRYGVNFQKSVLFTAQDLDTTAACMCYLQLSLLGCPGYVCIANTLTNPCVCLDKRALIPAPKQDIWYTPLYFTTEWHYRRIWAQMDMLFESTGNTEKKELPPTPPVKQKKARKPKATNPPEEVKAEPEPVQNTFTETKTGQLTFF